MSKGLFITATGTDVGKTFVTALIAKKLRENQLNVGYYKAALSGAEERDGQWIAGDAKYVCAISGLRYGVDTKISYTYKTAVSPHLAANLEGNPVTLSVIEKDFQAAKAQYDYLCLEGSGGVICPLRIDEGHTILLEDVIKLLDLSVLIVTPAGLGAINAAVLTVAYIRTRGIPISGIVFNHFEVGNFLHEDNEKQIGFLTNLPVVARVKEGDRDLDIEIDSLKSLFKEV